MIEHISGFVGGYAVGSLPVGYLLVKYTARMDIRSSGSGNVGALNAGTVTGSKSIGITVGVLDGIKGLVAVLLARQVFDTFPPAGLALLGAVVGHNYPVWLRFHGGRGLATACGGLFIIGAAYIILWCSVWAVSKWQKKSVLAANVIATIAAPIVVILVPSEAISFVMTSPASAEEYKLFSVMLSALLLVSHRDALSEVRKEGRP